VKLAREKVGQTSRRACASASPERTAFAALRTHIKPVFRVPLDYHEQPVRIVEQKVGLPSHNANPAALIEAPTIVLAL
jgi:hypothetical protein